VISESHKCLEFEYDWDWNSEDPANDSEVYPRVVSAALEAMPRTWKARESKPVKWKRYEQIPRAKAHPGDVRFLVPKMCDRRRGAPTQDTCTEYRSLCVLCRRWVCPRHATETADDQLRCHKCDRSHFPDRARAPPDSSENEA